MTGSSAGLLLARHHLFDRQRRSCILERPGYPRGRLELADERLAARHLGFAPDELLEPVLGFDPRSASLRPARRGGDRQLKPEPIGLARGEAERILPFGRHVDQAFIDDLRGLQRCVEVLQAADPDALHPRHVLGDAVLGDVAVHPVPPHPRAGAVGWVTELVLELRLRCGRRRRRNIVRKRGNRTQRGRGAKRNADGDSQACHPCPFQNVSNRDQTIPAPSPTGLRSCALRSRQRLAR